jgi:T5SS/PEP-CTERM-associated repeat protein
MKRLRNIAGFYVWAGVVLLLPGFMTPAAGAVNAHPGSSVAGPFDSRAAVKLKYPCQASFGSVQIPASAWDASLVATGHDGATFTVYSNYRPDRPPDPPATDCAGDWEKADGINQWGLKYQCTELAVRAADAEWGVGNWSAWKKAGWDGAADTMMGPGQRLGLAWTDNGAGSLPVPGDLLIWKSSGGGDPGHVAVVSAVGPDTVTFVGENQGYGMVTLPVSGTTVENDGWKKKSEILGWLSGGWTAVKAPLPADASAALGVDLNSVACPSPSWCAAVGTYEDKSGQPLPLMLTRSGTSWKATRGPLPGNAGTTATSNTSLDAVACRSASWCVAAGTYTDRSGRSQGLLLTWTGSKWTAAAPPLPKPDQGSRLNGSQLATVACSAATMCVAAGTYSEYSPGTGESRARGLLLSWSGKSWTPAKAPLPGGGNTELAPIFNPFEAGATCPTASSCTVTGSYYSATTTEGLLETWFRKSWTPARAPLPAGTHLSPGGASIVSVACPSASSCVATGYYQDSSNVVHGLVLTGDGRRWKVAATPARQFLWSAACPSVSRCVIGGNGALLTGTGTSWKVIKAPPLAAGAALYSVACPSVSACAIAAPPAAGDGGSQVVTGAGSTWTATDVLAPGGAGSGTTLISMACSTVSACVAIGNYTNESGTVQGLIATGPI